MSRSRQYFTAIEAHEGPVPGGPNICDNAQIIASTDLNADTVAAALKFLWINNQIEGILGLGGDKPSLNGIIRVLPGRERSWWPEGRYVAQP